MALLVDAGLLNEQTTIVTTVHEVQLLDDELPEEEHDFRVDLIVTPNRVIRCGPSKRPDGLNLDRISQAQIAAIPVLQQTTSNRD